MSFLSDLFSQGVQGQDSNGGFGTAAMFNQPTNRGDLIALLKRFNLADLLKSYGQSQDNSQMPQSNSLPNFTPYQSTPMGPDYNINNVYGLSPNGSIMPNWNRR